jgi:hypothetical protein
MVIFVIGERIYHVPDQIHEDAPHPVVNRVIDHLLAVSRGAKKAARSQHAEVMAY